MSSQRISINEVGPRDGLQAQSQHLSLSQRQQLVEALLAANLHQIEVGSFVSPKAVPQMAGTDALFAALQAPKGVRLSALVPNMRGYENAVAAGVKTVAVVASATETMNQKNINMSLAQTFDVSRSIIERGHSDGITVQAYLSVAFECPFEGSVKPDLIRQQAQQLAQWGADEVVIADTIGAANPSQVQALMTSLVTEHGSERLACHFHDTRAMGLANVYAAIESGVRRFDSALGGLGGCPFAPGAKGNVATEDVVMMCEQMGFSTGVDMPALLRAVAMVSEMTGVEQGGRAHYWISNNAA
ncbi:MAG: hydroxymethylglutaryl-CoA lyase [Halioglobus sp.]